VRGWCPAVGTPLEAADGWLVRVRLPGGAITPGQLAEVARLAGTDGNGLLEVTSRANLQLRGLCERSLDVVSRALVDAGLASVDPAVAAVPGIVTNPLAGHDPAALADGSAVVAAIAGRLRQEDLTGLPAKFGVVVDDGGTWPLAGLDADLHLMARSDGWWDLGLRGAASGAVTDDPVAAVVAAARLASAARQRLDAALAPHGIDHIGVTLGATPAAPEERERPLSDVPGLRAHPDGARANVVVAAFLGLLEAEVAAGLAQLAARSNGALRLTTRGGVALCGVASAIAPHLVAAARSLGLVVTGDDRRADISACIGRRGCTSGLGDTWQEASQRLATNRDRLHLSGCEKACGAPPGVRHLVADQSGRFVPVAS
jgi:precorrin-3B synthase